MKRIELRNFNIAKFRILSNRQSKRDGNSGRWTLDEHVKFLQGLHNHRKDWKLVQNHVPQRTGPQIRSHAQKFFKRISTSCVGNESAIQ
jgi:SHAQKYF class myb-like DNA-binding protein